MTADPLEPPLNPTHIAFHALQYRLATVSDSFTSSRFNAEQVATTAVDSADPQIDAAIRRITEIWRRAGLDPDEITEPWYGPRIDQVFEDDPAMLDAIDDIIRAVHRVQFSRPRRRLNQPRHRPAHR